MAEKPRAKMFSSAEICIIREFMNDQWSGIKLCHSQGGPSNRARVERKWEELTGLVNAVGNGPRSSKQIKEKWRNMMKAAKTELAEERKSARTTGGGPPRQEMSQTPRAVVDLLGDSASFSGIPSASDCETHINMLSQATFQDQPWSDVTIPDPDHLPTTESEMRMNTSALFTAAAALAKDHTKPDESFLALMREETTSTTRSTSPESKEKTSKTTPINRKETPPTTLKEAQLRHYQKQAELADETIKLYRALASLAKAWETKIVNE